MGGGGGECVDLALMLLAAGISVVPVASDGTKRPAVKSWERFMRAPMSADEARQLFAGRVGVAMVCGRVSGLEVLDFDDAHTYQRWRELVGDLLPDWVPIVQTPRPGYHVLLRRAAPPGNRKLARRREGDRVLVLAETRGEGGYALAPGTPGYCHESGVGWEQIAGALLVPAGGGEHQEGKRWCDLQPIAEDIYQPLIALAVTLNEDAGLLLGPLEKRDPTAERPGDDFNRRAIWADILTPHGWKVSRDFGGGKVYWQRPGDSKGHHATTGFCSAGSKDLFYCFSTKTTLPDGKALDKLGLYAHLNHGGDISAAAKALAAEGYGAVDPQAAAKIARKAAELEAEADAIGDKATAKAARAVKVEKEAEAAKVERDRPMTREEAIELLAELLELPIERVVQTRVEEPDYLLLLEGEWIDMGGVGSLLSSRLFEERLFERCRRPLPAAAKGRKGWPRVVALLGKAIEIEDPDYRRSEQTREWIQDYVDGIGAGSHPVWDEKGEKGWGPALQHGDSFRRGGEIGLHAGSLRSWLVRQGVLISDAELWQRLRGVGAQRRRVAAKLEGVCVTRSYWLLAEEPGRSNQAEDSNTA